VIPRDSVPAVFLRRAAVAVVLLALPLPSLADSAADADADKLIAAWEGVYKHQFKSGFYEEGKAPDENTVLVEDVVEIARHDRTHLYVRADLHFFNGHICGISGIASYAGGAFVYRDPDPDSGADGQPCTLRVSATKTHLVLDDRSGDGAATCSFYCGARGSLSGYEIELGRRRPIRYLPRLKASSEYKRAVEQLAASARAPTPAKKP
jgi:hypothetical protein